MVPGSGQLASVTPPGTAMQLELDFLPETEQPLPADPSTDADLGRFIRAQMAYGSVRERQGAAHRFALTRGALVTLTSALRKQAEARQPAAMIEILALLSGIPPADAGSIGLLVGSPGTRPPVNVDLRGGQLHTDLSQIALGQAVQPPENGTALPASHILIKPLPTFWVAAAREAAARQPDATCAGELFPNAFAHPGIPVPHPGSQTDGRLRSTHARARAGLSVLSLTLGLDNYDAALVTSDFSLIDKSRLFYVRSDPIRIVEGCRAVYDALGWGPPASLEVPLPFGSKAVADDGCVQDVYRYLLQQATRSHPGRRYTTESLLLHHNSYALLTGWLLAFCVGAREGTVYDFTARSCQPNCAFIPYRDKLTGPFKQIRPAFLCKVARDQVAVWWQHLKTLQERLSRSGLPPRTPWLTQLDAIFANDRVPLLFLVRDDIAVPLGSSEVAAAVPSSIRLLPNAGRHYWQTRLHRERVSSSVIDQYARHACRGTESLSSTSLLPPVAAHEVVCGVQDDVLHKLGIAAVGGLGRKAPL